MYQVIDVSAGGTFIDAGTPSRGLGGATITAAAATATLKIQESGTNRILAMLSAPANSSDHYTPVEPIVFQGQLVITVTGAAAIALIELY